jgi:predicted TPR repeat methyltransferase
MKKTTIHVPNEERIGMSAGLEAKMKALAPDAVAAWFREIAMMHESGDTLTAADALSALAIARVHGVLIADMLDLHKPEMLDDETDAP